MKIAVNGFGRIGRSFVRTFLQDTAAQKKFELSVINIGPARLSYVAHMFKYDTLMGIYPAEIHLEGNELIIDGYRITIMTEPDVTKINWRIYNIDWVVDCTGKFTHAADAKKHLDAGAQYVLISAPTHDEDISIIPGVNHQQFNKNTHHIVSLGSCTTNAYIPLMHVLHNQFGVQHGFMQTVHAYTNSQVLLDVETKDLRRSRAAALNIIPTTTGASAMLAKVIPALKGKMIESALRVPVGKVSFLEITVTVDKQVSTEIVNNTFTRSKENELKDVLDITFEPLVSSDFSGNEYSVVVDGLLTQAMHNSIRVFGWYDNEWAYSVRMKDFLCMVNT